MPYKDPIKRKEGQHRWYKKHHVSELRRLATNKRKFKDWYESLKEGPCADCGLEYPPYVMHWDHLPEFEKVASLGDIVQYQNRTKVLEEIAKCELVCANCHAERTHCRLGELADPPVSDTGVF